MILQVGDYLCMTMNFSSVSSAAARSARRVASCII